MANLCKHIAVLGILIFLELSGFVSGEISAEDVYDLLSRSIFRIENDIDNMKQRIEKVEKKFQGISTTVSPQLDGSAFKQNEMIGLKEDMNMQELAIKKTLTAEKLILRDTVEAFEFKFAEFRSQIQKIIASMNASLEGKSEVMFDIVNTSSSKLETGIAELKADLSETTNNMSQFLETMEITMMSNFEDMEKRMVANITMHQREIYDITNSSAFALATGIETLKSDWNSTANNISEMVKIMERSMQSDIKETEKILTDDIARKQSTTQTSLNSLQNSLNSLSSSVSSISYTQTNTVQPELKSLSTRISSVSSSLSSESSSLSSQISSLSNRMSEKEKRKVAFSASIYNQPDSIYLPNERIIFDRVHYNEGSGYSSSSGIFTAPKTGTYVFSVNIETTNAGEGHVLVMINGYSKCQALAEKGYDSTRGCTAVSYVYSGQQVWVQTAAVDLSHLYVYKYRSQFKGFLID